MLGSNAHILGIGRLAFVASLLLLPYTAVSEELPGGLCIYKGYTDIELARYAPDQSGAFSLSFLHSVSLTPVVDVYEIRSAGLHQVAEIFEAHGAGLPSFAGDVGEIGWRFEEGKFVLEMDRQFHRIQLRIQHEYLNTLHIADQTITLADFDAKSLGLQICGKRGD